MEVVDWNLARSTARQFAPSGPGVSAEEARSAVAELRALSRFAVDPVRERTGLDAGDSPDAAVIDRGAWIDSNVADLSDPDWTDVIAGGRFGSREAFWMNDAVGQFLEGIFGRPVLITGDAAVHIEKFDLA